MLYELSEKVLEMERTGKKVIKLNVGEPDQKTPEVIVKEAINSLMKESIRYGPAGGEMFLRERIAEMKNAKPENIVITPGSKWMIYAFMNVTMERGENVIIPSPHWTAYELMAKNMGLEARLLERKQDKNWDIDVGKLESMINEKTKMIILNNPSNPTSTIIRKKRMDEIIDISERKGVRILFDLAYADLAFKGMERPEGERMLMVESFSKSLLMSGWRIGFGVCPKDIADRVIRLNQMTITSVPRFTQRACLIGIENREDIARKTRDVYRERASFAVEILRKNGIELSEPESGFYVFPDIGKDSVRFSFELLKKEGIAIVPGTAFGNYRNHVRISLTQEINILREALEKICKEVSK